MATHRMTAARKAALRKAQMASARKRRGSHLRRGARTVKGVASAQRSFLRTKRGAKGKRTKAAFKNEMKFYKGGAIKGARVLTGAKPKSRKNQHLSSKGVTKRFVHGVRTNNANFKRTVGYAKKVRRSRVRRAIKGH